jgi:hypothetical protein
MRERFAFAFSPTDRNHYPQPTFSPGCRTTTPVMKKNQSGKVLNAVNNGLSRQRYAVRE